MNDGTRVTRRPRRAWPATAGIAAAIVCAVATGGLLAAACGGTRSAASSGGSPTAQGSANSPSAIAYSHCMRSDGVPNFPDPPGGGRVPKADAQRLGVSSSQLQAAQRACQHLYPGNGGAISASLEQCEQTGDCPQAMVQRVLNGMRMMALCMRSHGVPGWPDPTVDSEGRPGFNLLHAQGFNPNSAQIDNKMQECAHAMPGGAPVPVIRPGGPG
jgi:hypothetical protein